MKGLDQVGGERGIKGLFGFRVKALEENVDVMRPKRKIKEAKGNGCWRGEEIRMPL